VGTALGRGLGLALGVGGATVDDATVDVGSPAVDGGVEASADAGERDGRIRPGVAGATDGVVLPQPTMSVTSNRRGAPRIRIRETCRVRVCCVNW
jgi:hypothetical protein